MTKGSDLHRKLSLRDQRERSVAQDKGSSHAEPGVLSLFESNMFLGTLARSWASLSTSGATQSIGAVCEFFSVKGPPLQSWDEGLNSDVAVQACSGMYVNVLGFRTAKKIGMFQDVRIMAELKKEKKYQF